jgi:hypothetical protein
MTKDLALLVGPDQKWLTTEGFLDKVDENLKKAMHPLRHDGLLEEFWLPARPDGNRRRLLCRRPVADAKSHCLRYRPLRLAQLARRLAARLNLHSALQSFLNLIHQS